VAIVPTLLNLFIKYIIFFIQKLTI